MDEMSAESLRELGGRYREGDGIDADPEKAAECYRRAAAMGDSKAASSLGYMLLVGEGIPCDRCASERYLTAAAEAGEMSAMINLGNLLMEDDPKSAAVWFGKAAEGGSVKGMRNLATMYRLGNGIPKDPEKAAELLSIAAVLGDIDSISVLAHMLRTGEGVPEDKAGAAKLYRQAAELGDADSQYDLAFMLDTGEGVPVDHTEAEKWFRMSAEQGDTDACLCIGGIMFEKGEYAQAEDFFTTAALKGDVKAMYNLGLLYSGPYMGDPDAGKASEWFESAANEGFVLAQTMMGSICLDCGRVPDAERWFRLAADAGEPTAQYNLGAMALSGQIGMDDREAFEYLTRAASSGMQEAGQLLSAMINRQ